MSHLLRKLLKFVITLRPVNTITVKVLAKSSKHKVLVHAVGDIGNMGDVGNVGTKTLGCSDFPWRRIRIRKQKKSHKNLIYASFTLIFHS